MKITRLRQTSRRDRKLARLPHVEQGWSVFPVPRGTKKSHKSAEHWGGRRWGQTRDPDELKKDWAKWPDANIGIPCGPDNGIWVLEIDTTLGHLTNGFTALAELEASHGALPGTLQAISPSGSRHYYFRYPETVAIRNSTSKVGAGIDVRGAGGMVVAPPSVRRADEYRCHHVAPIVDVPPWLIELAREEEQPWQKFPDDHKRHQAANPE
jgi:hypothetical protein